MKIPSFHKKRDSTLNSLERHWREGPVSMPAARADIESYLSTKGRHAAKKWAKLVSTATERSPLLGAFVRDSRVAVAPKWQTLPTELKGEIAKWCGAPALGQLSQVSKDWNATLKNQWVWRGAYPSTVPHRLPAAPADWRKLAIEQSVIARRLGARPQLDPINLSPEEAIVAWQSKSHEDRWSTVGLSTLVDALAGAKRASEAAHWLRELEQRHPEATPTQYAKLSRFATEGHLPLLEAMLDVGAPVDYRCSERNSTALMFAAWVGNVDAVRFFLARGADANAVNNQGSTALTFALWNAKGGPHVEVAQELVAAGAPVDYRCSEHNSTALMFAARVGNVDAVRFFLARGADANAVNNQGITALTFALWNAKGGPHVEVAQELVAAGAPVDYRCSEHNSTALMFAAWVGNVDAVRFFLARGADANAVNNQGSTALTFALGNAKGGPHVEVANILREVMT